MSTPHACEAIQREIAWWKDAESRAEARLREALEDEKRAHSNVDFWREEAHHAVARRQEYEEALRTLRAAASPGTKEDTDE